MTIVWVSVVECDAQGCVVNVLPSGRSVRQSIVDEEQEAEWSHLDPLKDATGGGLRSRAMPLYWGEELDGFADDGFVLHLIKRFFKVDKGEGYGYLAFVQVTVNEV